jgi:hypothetical protein
MEQLANEFYAALQMLNACWMPMVSLIGQFESGQVQTLDWSEPRMRALKAALIEIGVRGQPCIAAIAPYAGNYNPVWWAGFQAYVNDCGQIGVAIPLNGALTIQDAESIIVNYSHLFNDINTYRDPFNFGLPPII